MKQCMDSPNLHRRLAKIIGQIQAIDRMIDEDIPCEDILSQINAAKSALNKAGQVVLEGHIRHCVRDGIEHGDGGRNNRKIYQSGRTLCQYAVNTGIPFSPTVSLFRCILDAVVYTKTLFSKASIKCR